MSQRRLYLQNSVEFDPAEFKLTEPDFPLAKVDSGGRQGYMPGGSGRWHPY